MESNKKIMLFGGSYNPIHQGHINAALTSSFYLKVDEVWLIPRKYNYDGSLLLSGKHRVNMINLAISELPNFKVCNVELLDKKHELIYTYNTAVKLTKKYKDIDFYFLIGADQLNNFRHWYKANELATIFHLVCYKRPGYEIDQSIVKEYGIKVIDGPQIDISSTLVRSGVFKKIDEDIQQYIVDHQLYLKERVMPRLPEERFVHVLSTAHISKEIAKANNVDTNNAYIAGILHDIAKGLNKDEVFDIIKTNYKSKINYPKFSYHAYASAYIAKTQFGVKNKMVLRAIEHHTIATKTMSKLEKIIYCADKIEESRPFANSLNEIRKLAFVDIDLCFIEVMKDQVRVLKERKEKISKNIFEMIEFYERKYQNER